jgi:hypothetical protein
MTIQTWNRPPAPVPVCYARGYDDKALKIHNLKAGYGSVIPPVCTPATKRYDSFTLLKSLATTKPGLHPREDDIRAALGSILASPVFAGSARSKGFLRFVVEEWLAGRAEEIKERTIAIEVFGRDTDYDPAHDSIVRVKALEVRKRLAQYYKEHHDVPLRIELPAGHYVPVVQPLAPPRDIRLRHWKTAAALLLAAGALALWFTTQRTVTARHALDALWAPAIQPRTPVLISLPAPLVWDVDFSKGGLPEGPAVPVDKLGKKTNYYVGIGAAYGAAQFASLLTARHVPFVLKIGQEVSLEDLKGQPAILLGAFTSEWTMRLTSGLRYTFVQEAARHGIVDTENPGRGWYQPRLLHSEQMTDALSMVVRLTTADTGRPVFMAAGATAHGTQNAAEFLTTPALFEEFAAIAPAGWEKQNLQIILRSEVHRGRAGRPQILATHVWPGRNQAAPQSR